MQIFEFSKLEIFGNSKIKKILDFFSLENQNLAPKTVNLRIVRLFDISHYW